MRLYVPLSHREYTALAQLAYEERRRPQDQAAVLVAHALGVGAATSSPPTPESGPEGIAPTGELPDDPVGGETA
jgi:hypothetical protein